MSEFILIVPGMPDIATGGVYDGNVRDYRKLLFAMVVPEEEHFEKIEEKTIYYREQMCAMNFTVEEATEKHIEAIQHDMGVEL